MSGNLCRCGAHNGIIAAIAESLGGGRGMTPFTYARAGDAAEAVRLGGWSRRHISAAAPTWSI